MEKENGRGKEMGMIDILAANVTFYSLATKVIV